MENDEPQMKHTNSFLNSFFFSLITKFEFKMSRESEMLQQMQTKLVFFFWHNGHGFFCGILKTN